MIKLTIGHKEYEVDGEKKEMDVAPFLQGCRTFVPIRFVSEVFGYNVEWEEDVQTVCIGGRQHFLSADECAIDWAMKYNNLSVGLHKELASSIYLCDKGYYYTKPNIGQSNSAIPSIEHGKKRIAVIHSHASTGNGTQKGDKLSSGDVTAAKEWKCDNYAATPCGTLIVYRYATSERETVSRTIPFDRRAINKMKLWGYDTTPCEKAFSEYPDLKVSVEADFYNQLFREKRNFPLYKEDYI